MDTKRIVIKNRENPADEELVEAARILKEGGLVAFPTETVYGLGGNALDGDAARRIYGGTVWSGRCAGSSSSKKSRSLGCAGGCN